MALMAVIGLGACSASADTESNLRHLRSPPPRLRNPALGTAQPRREPRASPMRGYSLASRRLLPGPPRNWASICDMGF